MSLVFLGGPPDGGGGDPEPGTGLTAKLQVARLGAQRTGGGATATGLVQAMVAIEPGTDPVFNIGGVDCDAWPVTRDRVTGEPDVYRVAAPLANPNGTWSTIGVAAGADQLVVTQSPGTPAPASLLECNLEGFELAVRVAGVGTTRHVARPFLTGHPSILSHRVRREGRYLRQTETIVRFIRQGVSTPTAPEDSVLIAAVYRTTRCDYRAETIDVVVMNGAWSSADDPYQESEAGDGVVHFAFVKARGYETQDTVDFVAPRLHQNAGATESNLVNVPPGWPDAWHHFPPGSWFSRRMVVYRTAAVPAQVAEDIVRRRDFGMTEGDLGYSNGNWGGWSTLPRFSELPPPRGGATTYDDLIAVGEENLAARMASINSDQGFDNSPDGGWKQPFLGKSPSETGSRWLDLMGMEAPVNEHLTSLLIETDQAAERQHLAMFDLATMRAPRAKDLALPDGRLPYGFGSQGRSYEYLHPHHNWPGRYNDVAHNLAPTGLPWNTLPEGSTAPFLQVTDWLNNGSLEWGPHYVTHHGRALGTFRAAMYAMDDPVAELALRFRARVSNCAYYNHDLVTNGPIRRRENERQTSCLFAIWNDNVQNRPRNVGGWTGYQSPNARGFGHAISTIVTVDHFDDDGGRAALRGDGDSEHDFFLLVGRILDWVTTGTGMVTASDGWNNLIYEGDPPNLTTRRGAMPNRDDPDQAAAGITEKWATTQVSHQAYCAQWYHVVADVVGRSYPGLETLLDRALGFPSITEDGVQAFWGNSQYGMPHVIPCSIGPDGINNTPLTEAQARAGVAFWAGWLAQPHLEGTTFNRMRSVMTYISAYRHRFGNYGNTLRLAKRQFGPPNGVSDAELVRQMWNFCVGQFYADSSPADFQLEMLNLIAAMQADGIRHPDVPA